MNTFWSSQTRNSKSTVSLDGFFAPMLGEECL
jgi:hypothetical protein